MEKKFKVPLIVIGILALVVGGVSAVITGYKLFTARSYFTIEEGVEVQYKVGTEWLPLVVNGGTFDLGPVTIQPGEIDSFRLRAKNIATSGTIGLKLDIDVISGLTYDVVCNTESQAIVEYTDVDDFLFRLPSDGLWRSVDITTTADGSVALGGIEFNNNLYRQNAENIYVSVCPI